MQIDHKVRRVSQSTILQDWRATGKTLRLVCIVVAMLSAASSVRAADCNTNGVDDALDISASTSADCDTNGIPDECQPDCNGNSIADRCDVSGGGSDDLNANLIPDECEGPLVVVSREFSVYNNSLDDVNSIDDAISREFSVYNNMFDNGMDFMGAVSREFSVLVPPLVLDMDLIPTMAGEITPPMCTVDYTAGDMVDITAVATNGYDFSFWGATSGADVDDPLLPCTIVTVNDNSSVVANFVLSDTVSVYWTGDGDGVSWSDPANWCPEFVPDETGDLSFRAVIDGALSVVQLDISPTITRLELLNDAQLLINSTTGSQSLTVSDTVINQGTINVSEGAGFDLIGDMDQSPDGNVLIADGSLVQFVNGTIAGGFILIEPGSGSLFDLVGTASLATVGIQDLVIPNSIVINVDGIAINVNSMFVDAINTDTGIDATTDLTLQPVPSQQADLILGDEQFAFLGNASSSLTNSAGHQILGAGEIRASTIENIGTIGAVPTTLGGVAPETLTVQAPVNNAGVLRADAGFTLRLNGVVDQSASGAIEANGGGIVALNQDVIGTGSIRSLVPCFGGFRGCTPPLLRATDGTTVAAQTMEALDTGVVRLEGDAQVTLAGAATVAGGTLECEPGASGSLVADSFSLRTDGGFQGSIRLESFLSMQSTGSFVIMPCGGFFRGCTPPLLTVVNDSALDIDGAFAIQTDTELLVDSTQPVTLAGDFLNASTSPGLFDWQNGRLTLDGSQPQTYEVAGVDFGATTNGLISNFAIGELEIASGADVSFINSNANTTTSAPCDEALYVETLILPSGASVTVNDVRVYVRHLIYEGGAIQSFGCGQLVVIPTGDFDGNGVVDVADHAGFVSCAAGPGIAIVDPTCGALDFDGDSDIDLADFAGFAAVFTP